MKTTMTATRKNYAFLNYFLFIQSYSPSILNVILSWFVRFSLVFVNVFKNFKVCFIFIFQIGTIPVIKKRTMEELDREVSSLMSNKRLYINEEVCIYTVVVLRS